MLFFSYLHFFAFVTYCCLAAFVLSRGPRNKLNQACICFIACLAVWSLQYSFLQTPWTTEAEARLWTGVGAFGWIGAGWSFLWLVHIFTGQEKRLGAPWYHCLVSVPPVVLIGAQWDGLIVSGFAREWYGMAYSFSDTFWTPLSLLYCLGSLGAGLLLLVRFERRESNRFKRKQALAMCYFTLISVVIGSTTDALLPLFGIHRLPGMGDLVSLIWAVGLSYSIVKYRFLTITPATAAENIISTMSDLLVLCDPAGRIVTVNQAALQRLGYERREIEGQQFFRFVAFEDEEEYLHFARKFGRNSLDSSKLKLKTKAGADISAIVSVSPMKDEQGEVMGTVVVAMDITLLMDTERALRRSEERYKDLVENINDVIYTLDTNGTVTYVSSPVLGLTGYRSEELLGAHIEKLVPPDETPRLRRGLQAALEGRSGSDNFQLVRKDGTSGWVHASARPAMEMGRISGLQGVLTDISEQVRAVHERQVLEAQLAKAQKMEAIGTMAAGVAHDLNNILSGIASYPELLMMKLPADSPLRKPLQIIQQSGERAASVVQDLLTMGRRGVRCSEVVNLNDIVSEYLNSAEHKRTQAMHPQVSVGVSLAPDLLNIMGSPVHLSKSVMNLMINAFEAIPAEGGIDLVTENRYVDRPFAGYDHVQQGDYVVLTVADTGVGIDVPDMDRIFEPFYTKKAMGLSGSGLGMAVVWGTVKDHEGYVDVKSAVGRGTDLTLYFPVTREARAQSRETDAIEKYLGGGETILVVDDVYEQRLIATSILEGLGYVVSSATSGEEAVEYVRRFPVDVLLLDMVMEPGMDGLETYQRILRIWPDQKAIIASGYSETERIREVLKIGSAAYVKKPFTLRKIGGAIRKILGKDD
jgi:PAS domain S-box-containing protein